MYKTNAGSTYTIQSLHFFSCKFWGKFFCSWNNIKYQLQVSLYLCHAKIIIIWHVCLQYNNVCILTSLTCHWPLLLLLPFSSWVFQGLPFEQLAGSTYQALLAVVILEHPSLSFAFEVSCILIPKMQYQCAPETPSSFPPKQIKYLH